uniref:WLM domain-containing protein n=1 Tax=Oryza punctata TaxID=4537 RepID=A0A0E0LWI5_ORYPU
MEEKRIARISVTWRGRQLDVDADPSCTVKEFGQLLQDLTSVNPETLKLIIPQSTNKGSKLITPFSDPQSVLTLKEAAISDGKPIRMMGVFDGEIEEVSDNGNRPDLRIIGFEEEEQRLRQRTSGRPQVSLKLPQGQYIFCDFRTLHLPGIELNPPPSEALKRMHMLACDPGIIAIMNKNMGEEISLRLRTDDLKGFRKYESIKRTLLHELAHMVHSEHDANFFALNKQLNDEAASLDWTKSRGHVLSGLKIFDSYEDEFVLEPDSAVGHKLGGGSNSLASARVLSGSAAYKRFLNASADLESSKGSVTISGNEILVPGTKFEPDPDDVGQDFFQENAKVEPDPDDNDDMNVDVGTGASWSSVSRSFTEQDTISHSEPDPDDICHQSSAGCLEPDPDDSSNVDILSRELGIDGKQNGEPDPDDNDTSKFIPEPVNKMEVETESGSNFTILNSESDPDDSRNAILNKKLGTDRSDETTCEAVVEECGNKMEVETEQSRNSTTLKSEPDPDDHAAASNISELQRIEEPVAALCARLQKAIEMLRSQATPAEATSALQTLFKIIKNVIEHPHDIKYRRLRKSNPQFQRSVANYKAAMEVLELIGFCEDVVPDEIGRAETYLVLKRNDPGLLWLAKSSLEVSMA